MVRVIEGDALDVMSEMPGASIDAVCTDPPYGLSFMGRAWDHGVPGVPYWREALRVVKPGAPLLAFGGTRTHHRLMCAIEDAGFEIRDCLMWLHGQGFPKGKGCLKPGWEPIVLARKPAPTPWLNIDGCRIGADVLKSRKAGFSDSPILGSGAPGFIYEGAAGRWPANVVLDEEAAELLDEQSGTLGNAHRPNRVIGQRVTESDIYGKGLNILGATYADTGGASRFFYTSKASTAERGAGNDHPTVKPLALMRWLIRLVTPPGGTVLDPFCGSGSTLVAAGLEGFDAIGIDSDPHAVEIALSRTSQQAMSFEVPA